MAVELDGAEVPWRKHDPGVLLTVPSHLSYAFTDGADSVRINLTQ